VKILIFEKIRLFLRKYAYNQKGLIFVFERTPYSYSREPQIHAYSKEPHMLILKGAPYIHIFKRAPYLNSREPHTYAYSKEPHILPKEP